MDSKTVDVIITSPPYWGMRDYGVDEQIGLEDDYHDYLKIIHKVMKQLKRVLKDTGTCWVNLGDKMVNKSLLGIPQRFFVNCIDDGWIARNYIIWHKPNSLPNSVKDRFTGKYEPVMFFSKSQKYYFDLDAVRVKPGRKTIPFDIKVQMQNRGVTQEILNPIRPEEEMKKFKKNGERKNDHVPGRTQHSMHKKRNEFIDNKHNPHSKPGMNLHKHPGNFDQYGNPLNNPLGKNPGDVWTINPKPLKEAHHAVFPPELPLRILKCACPPDGIVLDPFFGAGTTGVAAEKLGRKWCGIDINEEYIKIARKRLNKYKNHSIL